MSGSCSLSCSTNSCIDSRLVDDPFQSDECAQNPIVKDAVAERKSLLKLCNSAPSFLAAASRRPGLAQAGDRECADSMSKIREAFCNQLASIFWRPSADWHEEEELTGQGSTVEKSCEFDRRISLILFFCRISKWLRRINGAGSSSRSTPACFCSQQIRCSQIVGSDIVEPRNLPNWRFALSQCSNDKQSSVLWMRFDHTSVFHWWFAGEDSHKICSEGLEIADGKKHSLATICSRFGGGESSREQFIHSAVAARQFKAWQYKAWFVFFL